jgi:hypothetical protein
MKAQPHRSYELLIIGQGPEDRRMVQAAIGLGMIVRYSKDDLDLSIIGGKEQFEELRLCLPMEDRNRTLIEERIISG